MSMLAKKVESTLARTKQSFREEVDINNIVAKARKGQAITHVAKGVPRFIDVSEVTDYKSALDMLRNTDAFFQRLPSALRREFDNDPSVFLDAMDTDEGRAKLEALGAPKIPAVVPVPPVVPPEPSTDGSHVHE